MIPRHPVQAASITAGYSFYLRRYSEEYLELACVDAVPEKQARARVAARAFCCDVSRDAVIMLRMKRSPLQVGRSAPTTPRSSWPRSASTTKATLRRRSNWSMPRLPPGPSGQVPVSHHRGRWSTRHDARPIFKEKLWDIIKRCELSAKEERRVKAYCAKKGVTYLSTPFSREARPPESWASRRSRLALASATTCPCSTTSRKGKPMILSTGMNDVASVKRSVDGSAAGVPAALMHCTSMYPTPYEKVRLGAITELAGRVPGVSVGLSDHSPGYLDLPRCRGAGRLRARKAFHRLALVARSRYGAFRSSLTSSRT